MVSLLVTLCENKRQLQRGEGDLVGKTQTSAEWHPGGNDLTKQEACTITNDECSGLSFQSWKYQLYFSLLEIRDKNIVASCNLCAGRKPLSTAKNSNSNLLKHLAKQHEANVGLTKEEPLHPKSQGLILNRHLLNSL